MGDGPPRIHRQAGNRVPADVRILCCTDGMEVDNSALTGESMPEPRHTKTEAVTRPAQRKRRREAVPAS